MSQKIRKTSHNDVVIPKMSRIRIPKDDDSSTILKKQNKNDLCNKCECDCQQCQYCKNRNQQQPKQTKTKESDKLKKEIMSLKEELDEVIDYWSELEKKDTILEPTNTHNTQDDSTQLDNLDDFDKEMIDYIFE